MTALLWYLAAWAGGYRLARGLGWSRQAAAGLALPLAGLTMSAALVLLHSAGLPWQWAPLAPWIASLAPSSPRERVTPGWECWLLGGLAALWSWAQPFPPHDFWLDGPVQALLARGHFPPVHPFLPTQPLAGPYGHDLWLAAAVNVTGLFPEDCAAAWRSLALFFLPAAVCAAFDTRSLGPALAALLGVCVGDWAGMLDLSFHHAASQHLFFWAALAAGRGELVACTLASGPLPALAAMLCAAERRPGWWGGWLLLSLLLLPQYALGDVEAARGLALGWRWPPGQEWEPYDYWRISCSWRLLGYHAGLEPMRASVLSWQTLQLHGLPLLLAPALTPWQPRTRAALILLVAPSLVDFGPIYNHEVFRFHFLAGALLATTLAAERPRLLPLLCLPGLLSLPWPQRRPPYDLDEAALAALRARCSGPVLTNLSRADQDHPYWIWTESLALAHLGRPASGHRAESSDPVGTPPWRLTAEARHFWREPDRATLRATGATAVLYDPQGLDTDILARLRGLDLPRGRGQQWEWLILPQDP